MPKLLGVREKRHQPFYDTLIRSAADSAAAPNTVAQRTKLFAQGNQGDTSITNLQTQSTFPSDQTFVVLAIRCYMQFVGSNAATMYTGVANQLYLQLVVGDKPQFGAPAWYFPQGGGIWACDSGTPIMANGVPTNEAILKLAKSIPIPARQGFQVDAEFFDVGTSSVRTEYLNASTTIGSREIKVLLDGIQTRDVL